MAQYFAVALCINTYAVSSSLLELQVQKCMAQTFMLVLGLHKIIAQRSACLALQQHYDVAQALKQKVPAAEASDAETSMAHDYNCL